MREQSLAVLVLVRGRDDVFKPIHERRPLDRGSRARLARESRLRDGRIWVGDVVGKSTESDKGDKEVNEMDREECVECLGKITFYFLFFIFWMSASYIAIVTNKIKLRKLTVVPKDLVVLDSLDDTGHHPSTLPRGRASPAIVPEKLVDLPQDAEREVTVVYGLWLGRERVGRGRERRGAIDLDWAVCKEFCF